MDDTEIVLKPCPFCTSKDIKYFDHVSYDSGVSIKCWLCEATGPRGKDVLEAGKKWNVMRAGR